MERIEYHDIVDKSDWERGPWDGEPDKVQWPDGETGLPCLIVRGPVGALCGYVGVPPGHPLHGIEHSQCLKGEACPTRNDHRSWCEHSPDSILEAHGGITFSSGCAEITREKWEDWRKRMKARRADAERFPYGDAARALKEWAACLDNYEAWVERSHARHICHVPSQGEPDGVWWFGFDCAHACDLAPGLRMPTFEWGQLDTYKDCAFVAGQCRDLAQQIATLARCGVASLPHPHHSDIT